MRKFNLELHPEKTRLLEFGSFAINNRQRREEGKPETFNFLGFTHICVKKRSNGMYTVLRQTIRKRLQAKLNAVKAELKRRMHEPISEQGKWLQAAVRGHIRYYGVPMNNPALALFRFQVGRLWHRALSRRTQNRSRTLGSYAAPHRSLAATAFRLSSLSPAPYGRRYLRQEPDAGNPPVRIRGGGCE
jgi:RNA-directed DNA polymerase